MAFDIRRLKGEMNGGGVRQNLFEVRLDPSGNFGGRGRSMVPFMVQATSIPSSDIAPIPVPYFGRIISLAGDRSFAPWAVQVVNDPDFTIRNDLETWHNRLNDRTLNIRSRAYALASNYKIDADVVQYAQTGEVLRTYRFIGMFPTSIGDIALSWADNNSIEVFPVTFQYDYWEVVENNTNTSGNYTGGINIA